MSPFKKLTIKHGGAYRRKPALQLPSSAYITRLLGDSHEMPYPEPLLWCLLIYAAHCLHWSCPGTPPLNYSSSQHPWPDNVNHRQRHSKYHLQKCHDHFHIIKQMVCFVRDSKSIYLSKRHVLPTFDRLKQEDGKFPASLSNPVKPHQGVGVCRDTEYL